MNISHEWLREFVPHTLSPEAVGDLLSAHVATLDAIERLRADLAPIVIARVVESERIPDTKLSFNRVDDGSGALLDVVCGAPNVAVGTLYPFARSGTTMPGGMQIEKRKIRGLTSNGMLCSARELGLGTDHEGILALDIDAPPGTPFLDAMPVGDSRFVLDVLPNRPDLLSHVGIAREVAALTGLTLGLPTEMGPSVAMPVATPGAAKAEAGGASVTVEDPVGCPRYVACLIRGLQVGPSPEWLRRRVESIGSRSISNVVDATNYVLHGLGQPVHAFDFARLAHGAIVVRKAQAGEKLVTLDGVERSLAPWMTIIADGERPTALAGVMGGHGSEVTEATTDVLLEVAYFAPGDVRAVRRALGLSTDASYRFERGVDRARTEWIAAQAAALIVAVAGGRVDAVLDVGVPPGALPPVRLRSTRVARLLGATVPDDEIERLLESVGFSLARVAGDEYVVRPPPWRHDVLREVDLVEEIARLRGFDLLPDDLRPYRPGTVPDHPLHLATRRVRDLLVGLGLAEVRPMPFTRGDGQPHVRVANPLADDEPFLRTSLLDTLARRAEYNLSRQQGNVRLFEVGSAFAPSDAGLPREDVRVAALVMGARRPPHFTEPKPPAYDAWDAKALAESLLLAAFPGEAGACVSGEGDVLWTLRAGNRDVGHIRHVPLDAPVWASAAFGVEITLAHMPSAPDAPRASHAYVGAASRERPTFARYRALPTTPAAEFDLALLVPDHLAAADVERVLRRSAGELLERLTLFDEFRGPLVAQGSRSIAWRLTFRHPERTLREKEIDGRRSQLLKTLEKELGVVPRSA